MLGSWIWPGEEEDPGDRKSAPVLLGLGCCKKSEGSSSRKWILGENGGSFSSTEKRSGVQSMLGGMTFEEGSFESKD